MQNDTFSSDLVTQTQPYAALTPEKVLDSLEQIGLVPDGRLMPLSSYENRVYQCGLDSPYQNHRHVVLKFYRPARWTEAQIQEEHAFAYALQHAEVPVVAPLMFEGQSLHRCDDFYFSVSPYRGGRRPELEDDEVLMWIGRFLARLHTVGEQQAFVHRPRLSRLHLGCSSRDWLLAHKALPLEMRSRWEQTVNRALDVLAEAAPELLMDEVFDKNLPKKEAENVTNKSASEFFDEENKLQFLRLHGDCHPGNILWTPMELPQGGPHFVDLDDARMGPAIQDLWMLLPGGNRKEQVEVLSVLVEGYEQFRPFNRRELALMEPLRTLRHIHYSAWLARRWQDPIFPINFPWFGSHAYWAEQIQQLEVQIEAMLEPPLVV
jgi:Ser/Thr protein kinase RdoA (MazF antagonist)